MAVGRSAEGPVDPATAFRATAVLIAIRIGYAFNWFDIGPALPGIGAAFNVGPADWGLLLATFLAAAGLCQVPAGLLARRWGSRSTSLLGAGLLGVAGLASAAAPNFPALVGLRAASGVGAALFFSPAIGLVASLYPEGRRGLPVGSFTTAFSVGSALGVFGAAVLIPIVGWRETVAFGGLGLLVLTAIAIPVIPPSTGRRAAPSPASGRLPAPLSSVALWCIGFAFVGIEGASFATGQFMVPWGLTRGWSPALAGTVGAAFLLPSAAAGPFGGPMAERHTNRRTQMVLAAVSAAVLLIALPWANVDEAIVVGAVFSFLYGLIYSVMYVVPHYLPEISAADVPLAIGLFNSVQLAGGAFVQFIFGGVVGDFGYTIAWLSLSGISLLTLAAIVGLPATGSRSSTAVPAAEAA